MAAATQSDQIPLIVFPQITPAANVVYVQVFSTPAALTSPRVARKYGNVKLAVRIRIKPSRRSFGACFPHMLAPGIVAAAVVARA